MGLSERPPDRRLVKPVNVTLRPAAADDCRPGPVESGGLTAAGVEQRRKTFGLNLLPRAAPVPLWRRLLSQFVHFFAVMLWIAAGLAILGRMPQLGLAIVVVVLLNGLFSFLQEYRAEKAADRLRDLLPRRVTVVREGYTRASMRRSSCRTTWC